MAPLELQGCYAASNLSRDYLLDDDSVVVVVRVRARVDKIITESDNAAITTAAGIEQ